ncbi:MAG: type IX secretion system outer membrane channel protein PorV [Chitinophagaceae bacterium]|nr:type IX secretion system outer membrane channel protein PorV [Chitinophagaceae bacterium]
MKRKTNCLVVTLFLVAGFTSLKAQTDSDPINVVTTAVPFLRISPDARAGGMGDLGVATNPDANASFWNLAKTPFNKSELGLGLTYTPWLKDLGLNDVYLLSFAGYTKLDEQQALSASIRYFSLGNIQFTDGNGNDFGSGRPREFGIDAGYSRKLSDNMGIGIALRFIHSNLVGGAPDQGSAYQAGNAVAGDISFFYTGADESGQGWNFGAAITNLGSKIGYTRDATQKDFIPTNLGLGAAYTKVFDETSKLMFGLDVHKLMVPTPPDLSKTDDTQDSVLISNYRNKGVVSSWLSSFGDAPGGFSEELKEFQFSLGTEYSYNDQFFARAGYFYENKDKGNRKYFTLGVGIKYNVFGLNFSYLVPTGAGINRNPLSNTLRFGLILDMADISSSSEETAPVN